MLSVKQCLCFQYVIQVLLFPFLRDTVSSKFKKTNCEKTGSSFADLLHLYCYDVIRRKVSGLGHLMTSILIFGGRFVCMIKLCRNPPHFVVFFVYDKMVRSCILCSLTKQTIMEMETEIKEIQQHNLLKPPPSFFNVLCLLEMLHTDFILHKIIFM